MQIESLSHSDKLRQVVAEYAQNCSWKAGATLAKQMKESHFSDWESSTEEFDKVYLVSDHVNLYEKYGFVKIDEKEAPWGAMETIFMHLT